MQVREQTVISTALYAPKVWKPFVDDVCSILKRNFII